VGLPLLFSLDKAEPFSYNTYYMKRKEFKPGGGAPEYGLTAVNLGNGLRRELEQVCRRHNVSLTDFVRMAIEQRIAREPFWKFQAFRYLLLSFHIMLNTDFALDSLGLSRKERKEWDYDLRELRKLVEDKAYEHFEPTPPSVDREKNDDSELSSLPVRKVGGFVRIPEGALHWDFEIPEVERILSDF